MMNTVSETAATAYCNSTRSIKGTDLLLTGSTAAVVKHHERLLSHALNEGRLCEQLLGEMRRAISCCKYAYSVTPSIAQI